MKHQLFALGFTLLFMNNSPCIAGEKKNQPTYIERKAEMNGIQLSAWMPESAAAGSPAIVRIALRNTNTESLRYLTQGKYADYQLKVVDASNNAMPLTRFGRMMYPKRNPLQVESGVFGKLQKGEHLEVGFNLARIFDLSHTGEYTLTVSKGITVANKSFNLSVEKITFRVREDE